MKLRRTLFAALAVAAMFPAVPASAAPLTKVTVTPLQPIVTVKDLAPGVKVQVQVHLASPISTLDATTAMLPALPNAPVEVTIGGVTKSGSTNAQTGIFEAKFLLGDFGSNVPSGPQAVTAVAYPSLSSVSAADVSVTSRGWATMYFDTALPPSGLVEQIDSGAAHTCAITTDTGARCWGAGGLGQIGNGETVDASSAKAVRSGSGPLTGLIAIDAGQNHTCALKANGEVWCWGSNARQQLGAAISGSASPVAVKANLTQPALAIAAGSEHTCAVIVDSTVRCWGRPGASFLGRGTLTTPVLASYDPITQTGKTLFGAVQIAAGQLHTCARLANATVVCWGDPSFNRLGGATAADAPTPRPVPTVDRATNVVAGRAHTCAVQTTGVVCWGFNLNGQLGRGDTTTDPAPVTLAGTPTAVTLGTTHSCFVVDGVTSCTGKNSNGAFGNGATTNTLTPVSVAQAGGTFAASAGDDHTCFVGPAAAAVTRCSGIGANGRLGHLAVTNSTTPVNTQGLDFARAIAAGTAHTCALLATPGKARCWGANDSGQLGDGTTVAKSSPTPVTVRPDAYAIAAGDNHTCVLAGNPNDAIGDMVQCWGENSAGQLGTGTTTDALIPTDVSGIAATAIALGADFTCAIAPTGQRTSVKCWGADGRGQLGDDVATAGKLVPTTVASLDGQQAQNVVSIDAGSNHACAVLALGDLHCWGDNTTSQLGQTENALEPRPIVAEFISGAATVTAGAGWTCVIDVEDRLQCFGRNDHGQLGYDGPDTAFPVLPPTLVGLDLVRAGGAHACAITAGSLSLSCWGSNVYGELGNTSPESTDPPADSSAPVSPLDDAFVIDVTGGANHTCAILRDTTVRCWGLNASGQVGDGSLVDRWLPSVITL